MPAKGASQHTIQALWKKPNQSATPSRRLLDKESQVTPKTPPPLQLSQTAFNLDTEDERKPAVTSKDNIEDSSSSCPTEKMGNLNIDSSTSSNVMASETEASQISLDTSSLTEFTPLSLSKPPNLDAQEKCPAFLNLVEPPRYNLVNEKKVSESKSTTDSTKVNSTSHVAIDAQQEETIAKNKFQGNKTLMLI